MGHVSFYYEDYNNGLSVGRTEKTQGLTVYPNPFEDKISVDWKEQRQDITLRLLNILGQEIFTVNRTFVTGRNSIAVPGLCQGAYVLLIQNADGRSRNSKLIKNAFINNT